MDKTQPVEIVDGTLVLDEATLRAAHIEGKARIIIQEGSILILPATEQSEDPVNNTFGMMRNLKQWTILSISIALFLLSEIFPPWIYVSAWNLCPAGYSFITHPPAVRAYEEMRKLCPGSDVANPEQFWTRKDESSLNWQRVIIGLLSVGLLLVFDTRRSVVKKALGGTMVGVGVIGFGVYLFILPIITYH